jgi:glycosyltransferase involved in cell wall biosynthesis
MIPDLRGGGAERVAVNLANNIDDDSIEFTLMTLFDVGINKDRLSERVRYKYWLPFRIRGIWRVFKFISPRLLHKLIIRDKYDVEISYLEGLCTKIVSGGNASRKIAWLHCELTNNYEYFHYLYNSKDEFMKIYSSYDLIVGVSKDVIKSFEGELPEKVEKRVVHNVLDTNEIDCKANMNSNLKLNSNSVNFISVGRLTQQKGYERLIKIFGELESKYPNIHLYILGDGQLKSELNNYILTKNIHCITLLGFVDNPYSVLKEMDCFICSSLQEGYSTAVSEALYLGVPVITTNCSGAEELCSNGAGIVVDNDEIALKKGIIEYLENAGLRKSLKIAASKKKETISTNSSLNEFYDCL